MINICEASFQKTQNVMVAIMDSTLINYHNPQTLNCTLTNNSYREVCNEKKCLYIQIRMTKA